MLFQTPKNIARKLHQFIRRTKIQRADRNNITNRSLTFTKTTLRNFSEKQLDPGVVLHHQAMAGAGDLRGISGDGEFRARWRR